MARSKRSSLALAAAALIPVCAPAAAALPPHVYEKMQREAPESLVLQVISVNAGGTMIEYEEEDPEIRRRYEAELKKRGVPSRMAAH